MNERWIADASPLIILARSGMLDLLFGLCPDPVIPHSVAEEIRMGRDGDPAKDWLTVDGERYVTGPVTPSPEVARWGLGDGESEVLTIALSAPLAVAILDDHAARKCAVASGIRVRGTLGIVVLAKRRGLIMEAAPAFDALRESGLRVSADLLAAAKALAGESE